MAKFEVYSLLVAGLAILPIYMLNRAGPTITRKKALDISTEHGEFVRIGLKYFWQFHVVNTALSSCLLIFLIESWQFNGLIVNIFSCAVLVLLTLLSGILASMPAYVMVKHWKKQRR